jgi:hypothetical protein
MADTADLTIKTNKAHGEADLQFQPSTSERLNELHESVVDEIDGVSAKGGVADFVVAIRKRDFDDVVKRIEEHYRGAGLSVRTISY